MAATCTRRSPPPRWTKDTVPHGTRCHQRRLDAADRRPPPPRSSRSRWTPSTRSLTRSWRAAVATQWAPHADPGMGAFAYFKDSEGNVVGLWENFGSPRTEPPDRAGYAPRSDRTGAAVRELHTPEERDDPSSVTPAPDDWSGSVTSCRFDRTSGTGSPRGSVAVRSSGSGPGSDPRLPWRPRPSSTHHLTRSSGCPPVAAAPRRSATRSPSRIDRSSPARLRGGRTRRGRHRSHRRDGQGQPARRGAARLDPRPWVDVVPARRRVRSRPARRARGAVREGPRGRLRDRWSHVDPCGFSAPHKGPGSGAQEESAALHGLVQTWSSRSMPPTSGCSRSSPGPRPPPRFRRRRTTSCSGRRGPGTHRPPEPLRTTHTRGTGGPFGPPVQSRLGMGQL